MFPFVEWPCILRDVSELNAVASDCQYTGRCNAFFSRYRKLVLMAELPHDKITTWHVVNPYSACLYVETSHIAYRLSVPSHLWQRGWLAVKFV